MTDEEIREAVIKSEMYRLKEKLSDLDYIGIKIAEGVATKEEYAAELAYKEELRKRINELEGELQ